MESPDWLADDVSRAKSRYVFIGKTGFAQDLIGMLSEHRAKYAVPPAFLNVPRDAVGASRLPSDAPIRQSVDSRQPADP